MKKLKTKLITTGAVKAGKSFSAMIMYIKQHLKQEFGIKWFFMTKETKNKYIADYYNALMEI